VLSLKSILGFFSSFSSPERHFADPLPMLQLSATKWPILDQLGLLLLFSKAVRLQYIADPSTLSLILRGLGPSSLVFDVYAVPLSYCFFFLSEEFSGPFAKSRFRPPVPAGPHRPFFAHLLSTPVGKGGSMKLDVIYRIIFQGMQFLFFLSWGSPLPPNLHGFSCIFLSLTLQVNATGATRFPS